MNGRIPYEYKILKYVHDSFTGECLNIGLVLYSKQAAFFRIKLLNRYSRLTSVFPDLDGKHFYKYINSLQNQFDLISLKINSKQLSMFQSLPNDVDDLVRAVLPIDDSAVQFGPSRGGVAGNLEIAFADLYLRLIESYLPIDDLQTRSDREIWQVYYEHIRPTLSHKALHEMTISTATSEVTFEHAWRNGRVNALQPISFDLQNPLSIQRKSHQWFGTSVILSSSSDIGLIYFLLGSPKKEDERQYKAYLIARDLLSSKEYSTKIKVVEEDEAPQFMEEISGKILEDIAHENN